MKKIILLFSIVMFSLVSMSQTLSNPTAATVNATVDSEYYKVLTLDTLTLIENANYIFRVKGTKALDFKIGLYVDRLAGTVEGRMAAYGSLNGTSWVALADSMSWTGLTADAMDIETIDMTDFMWPYLRLKITQTDTATVIYKPYIYAKF